MADGPSALSGRGPGSGLGLFTSGSSRLDAAGPSDPLQAERERIRREILELEQRLGVAAGSELCGGTGSGQCGLAWPGGGTGTLLLPLLGGGGGP
eukprot:g14465.t1